MHAQGHARAIEDTAWLHAFLSTLTAFHEAPQPRPWQLSDAPSDYIASQLKAVVGIEIRITRLSGKWKMSQNRAPEDIDGVVAGLRALPDAGSASMADDIERRRPR